MSIFLAIDPPGNPPDNLAGCPCPELSLRRPVPTGRGGFPRLLSLAMERLEYFFFRPKAIPPLFVNKDRVRRSEQRLSCILVAKALIKHMDLATLCCGTPTLSRGFVDISMKHIMADTGLGKRRIERAMQVLKAAGLVETSQPRGVSTEGKYFGCRAIRVVSKRLFVWLGLDKALLKEQVRRRRDLERMAAKAKKSFADMVRRFVPGRSKHNPSARGRGNETVNRRWNELCFEHLRDNPEASRDQILLHVNRRLQLPLDYSPGGGR